MYSGTEDIGEAGFPREASWGSCGDGEQSGMKATYGERSNEAARERKLAVEPTYGRVRTESWSGFSLSAT